MKNIMRQGSEHETVVRPEGAKPAEQAAIDRSVLEEIRLLQRKGAPDLLEKVITIYLADAPNTLKTIGDAVQGKDAREIYQAAHKLKSSSASVGALHLASLLAEAELLGREDRLEGVEDVLTQIREEYEAVKNALEAELGGGR